MSETSAPRPSASETSAPRPSAGETSAPRPNAGETDTHGTSAADGSAAGANPPEADESEATWSDEREIRIPAAPEAVWSAWAEPEHVRRWFSDEAHGRLEPGGELVHEFRGHGEHRYRVLEVDPPRRLVLDGEMDGRAFRQMVEIRREGGTTVLRLVHSGFGSQDPDSELVQGIDSGWTMALAVMRHYVERYFGRDKVSIPVFRPARYDYDALLSGRYLDAEGLGMWLTDGAAGIDAAGIGAAGSGAAGSGTAGRGAAGRGAAGIEDATSVELRLRSGRSLTGSVLARTDHEVSVSWEEIEGVLELKAFGTGPEQRFLGVRVLSWGAGADTAEALRGEMEEAVARLMERAPR